MPGNPIAPSRRTDLTILARTWSASPGTDRMKAQEQEHNGGSPVWLSEVVCVRRRDVVERIKDAVVPILTKRDQVVAAYLFGSAGTERATAMSDIDIAVLVDGGISLMDELSLSADVAAALGRDDVDLLVLNSARNDLQHVVISEGELILDRDPLKTSEFIEKVLSVHKDYGIYMRIFLSDLKSGLKEDYLHDR
jgi:predicted nucleotidyltransferase